MSEEEFKRPRTHVLHDVDIFAAYVWAPVILSVELCVTLLLPHRTDKVESLWKFTRQFHRVVGPRNPTIDKAETTFQAISKLQIPNRREYFKHR